MIQLKYGFLRRLCHCVRLAGMWIGLCGNMTRIVNLYEFGVLFDTDAILCRRLAVLQQTAL